MAQGFANNSKTHKKAQLQPKLPLIEIHQIQASLPNCFQEFPDLRVSRTKKHLLQDILVIAILAVIAGVQGLTRGGFLHKRYNATKQLPKLVE